MKLDTFQPSRKHMMCFVGKGGKGKTIAASMWPKPMYMGSLDGRLHAVYDWLMRHHPDWLKEIEFDEYKTNEYDKLATKLEKLQQNNPFSKGTIVIDPLTNLGLMGVAYSQAHRDKSKLDLPQLKMTQIDDYKVEATAIKRVFDVGRALSSHFIMCAHVLEETHYVLGEDKPRVRRSFLTAGKQPAAMIPGSFDEVWLFTVRHAAVTGGEPDYLVITRPTPEFDDLRTSCGVPPEIVWTKKDLYALTSLYLNRTLKKEESDAEAVQSTGSETGNKVESNS